MPSIKTQDLYRAVITEPSGIASSGDVDFTVSVAPRYTNGFLVLSPENATSRETVYFHNVVGNRVYVRSVNRKAPKYHAVNDFVQMNDVEEIFNFYADASSPLFYVEKVGSLNVKVWGGTVLVNRAQVTVVDTNLTLTDNTTNYIVYDYVTNVVSVNTTGAGLIKATIVTASGLITSITYNVIKESYADPYVPDLNLVAPEVQKQTWVYAAATGAVNTFAITLTPAPIAYAAGQKFTFKANLANTGTATLNVNGLGAKTIKKLGGTANVATGDILLGQIIEVTYNGVDFDMVSPLSSGVDTTTYIAGIANVQSSIGGVSMTLGETLATGDIVSIDPVTGKLNKLVVTGSDNNLVAASSTFMQVVSLSSTTVVFFWAQTNTIYSARAGTISGSTITLGSTVQLFNGGAGSTLFGGIVALDANTFVVGYLDKSTTSYISNGIVATVSGTTITTGVPVVIKNSTTNPQVFGTVTKVTSTKVAFHYNHNSDNKLRIGTISGTTLTLGTEQVGLAIQPTVSCNVANDKIAVSDGTNVRFYTTSGTVATEGNNLGLGLTYTSISMKDLGSSKAIFSGTNATNTYAFILDLSSTTPVQGTVVTVLAASTSNDCFKASSNSIGIATGNNKVYFYNYSGTTLTFENIYTSPSTIGGYNSTNYIIDNIFATTYTSGSNTFGYVMSNRPHYIVGILQSGGALDETKFVKVSGGISTIHSSLITGLAYSISKSGLTTGVGTIYIGKALSATSILVGISYNTL